MKPITLEQLLETSKIMKDKYVESSTCKECGKKFYLIDGFKILEQKEIQKCEEHEL